MITEKQIIKKLADCIDALLQDNEENHVDANQYAELFVKENIRPYIKQQITISWFREVGDDSRKEVAKKK